MSMSLFCFYVRLHSHECLAQWMRSANFVFDSDRQVPSVFISYRINVTISVCIHFDNLRKSISKLFLLLVQAAAGNYGARDWKSFGWHVRYAKRQTIYLFIFVNTLTIGCFNILPYFSISNDNITACLSANRHGLCIGGTCVCVEQKKIFLLLHFSFSFFVIKMYT